MRKRILNFIAFSLLATGTWAATRDATLTNTTGYNYNYMYPYMNNSMRTNLNPGVTPSQNSSLIDTVVRTTPMSNGRRVVPRTRQNTARTATTVSNRNTARSGIPAAQTAGTTNSRRVVARRGNLRGNQTQNVVPNASDNRSYPTYTARNATPTLLEETSSRIPATRCMADYTECMNGYCQRENTAYNRCYCSAKLSQIDATYQESISSLINEILSLKTTYEWSDAEMDEYWMETVGKYRGENSWANLDDALDINWADMDSRVRGQNAFTTGHEYCVQHLRGCFYMAANMRDAYRSEIARDCAVYEESLQQIKNAAESIVRTYQ